MFSDPQGTWSALVPFPTLSFSLFSSFSSILFLTLPFLLCLFHWSISAVVSGEAFYLLFSPLQPYVSDPQETWSALVSFPILSSSLFSSLCSGAGSQGAQFLAPPRNRAASDCSPWLPAPLHNGVAQRGPTTGPYNGEPQREDEKRKINTKKNKLKPLSSPYYSDLLPVIHWDVSKTKTEKQNPIQTQIRKEEKKTIKNQNISKKIF